MPRYLLGTVIMMSLRVMCSFVQARTWIKVSSWTLAMKIIVKSSFTETSSRDPSRTPINAP